MIPNWMRSTDRYVPPRDGGTFEIRTIQSLGGVMSRLQVQRGQQQGRALPAFWKLLLLLVMLVAVSVLQNRLALMAVTALVLGTLSFWPAKRLWQTLKSALAAAGLTLLLLLPAMLLHPAGASNQLVIVWKVFLSLTMLNMFNRTTQWNEITTALRRLHVPGIFVFTLDLTLKYIVLLGTLICDLLSALQLRAVGRHERKYQSVGGVMGVTFLRSAELSRETYEAMVCRGFTDDYKGL